MEPPTPGSLDNPDLGSTLNEVFTPEMREKMVRLEKENEILRRRLAERGPSPVEVGGGGGVRTGVRGGGEGEESLSRGRGGGGGEQMVAVLRKQLQEKEKKISQLEAAAQENSNSPSHHLLPLSFLYPSDFLSSFSLLPYIHRVLLSLSFAPLIMVVVSSPPFPPPLPSRISGQ